MRPETSPSKASRRATSDCASPRIGPCERTRCRCFTAQPKPNRTRSSSESETLDVLLEDEVPVYAGQTRLELAAVFSVRGQSPRESTRAQRSWLDVELLARDGGPLAGMTPRAQVEAERALSTVHCLAGEEEHGPPACVASPSLRNSDHHPCSAALSPTCSTSSCSWRGPTSRNGSASFSTEPRFTDPGRTGPGGGARASGGSGTSLRGRVRRRPGGPASLRGRGRRRGSGGRPRRGPSRAASRPVCTSSGSSSRPGRTTSRGIAFPGAQEGAGGRELLGRRGERLHEVAEREAEGPLEVLDHLLGRHAAPARGGGGREAREATESVGIEEPAGGGEVELGGRSVHGDKSIGRRIPTSPRSGSIALDATNDPSPPRRP